MSDIPTERRDEARKAFDQLHSDGLIIFHKGKKCASINTKYKEERKELKGEIPDYILNLR